MDHGKRPDSMRGMRYNVDKKLQPLQLLNVREKGMITTANQDGARQWRCHQCNKLQILADSGGISTKCHRCRASSGMSWEKFFAEYMSLFPHKIVQICAKTAP